MEAKRNNSLDLFLAAQSLRLGRPCRGWHEHLLRNTVVEPYNIMTKDEEEDIRKAPPPLLEAAGNNDAEDDDDQWEDAEDDDNKGANKRCSKNDDNNSSFHSCASTGPTHKVPLDRVLHIVRRNLLRPAVSKDISSTFCASAAVTSQHPHHKNAALSSRIDNEATLITKFVAAWDQHSAPRLYNLMFQHGEDMFDPAKPNSLSSFIALGGIDLFGRLLCCNAPFLFNDVEAVVQSHRREVASYQERIKRNPPRGRAAAVERSRKISNTTSVGDMIIKFPDVSDSSHTGDPVRYSPLLAHPVLTTGKRDADGAYILIVPPPNVYSNAPSINSGDPTFPFHDRSAYVTRSISVINYMVRVITEVVVCSTSMGWYLFDWAEGALLERLMALSQCSYIRDGALILIEHILSVVGPALHFESSPQLHKLLRGNVTRLSAAVEALHRITNVPTAPEGDNNHVVPDKPTSTTEVFQVNCTPNAAKDSRLVLGLKQLIEEEEVTLASLCRVLSLAVIAGIMSEPAHGSAATSKQARGFARKSADFAGTRRREPFPQCLTRIDMADAMMASNVYFLLETPNFVPCILRVLEKVDDQSSVRIFRGNRTLTLVSDETGQFYAEDGDYEDDDIDEFEMEEPPRPQGNNTTAAPVAAGGMQNLLAALQNMLQGGGQDINVQQLMQIIGPSGGNPAGQQMQGQTPLMAGMAPPMPAAAPNDATDPAQRLQEMADGITADMPESNAIDSLDFSWFIGTPHSQARWRLRSYGGGNGWGIQPLYANKTGKRRTVLSGNGVDSDEGFSVQGRIVAMLEKYDPERLRELDGLLEEYMGIETQLVKDLVLQYGPEPYVDSKLTSSSSTVRSEQMLTSLLLNRADADRLGPFHYDLQLEKKKGKGAAQPTLSSAVVRNASLFGSDLCFMLGRDPETIDKKQTVFTNMLTEYEKIMEWWQVPASEKRRKIKQERQVLLTCQSEVYFVLNSLMMTKFYTKAHALLTDCNIFPRLNMTFGKVFFTEVTSNSRYYDTNHQVGMTDDDENEDNNNNNNDAGNVSGKKKMVKFLTSLKTDVRGAEEKVSAISGSDTPTSPVSQSSTAAVAEQLSQLSVLAEQPPKPKLPMPLTGRYNPWTPPQKTATYEVIEQQLRDSEPEIYLLPHGDGFDDFSDEVADADHRHDPDTLRKLEVLRVVHEYTNGQDRGEILTTIHDSGVTSCRFELAEKLTERILACNEDPCVETTCFHTIESYLRLFGFYQWGEPDVASIELLAEDDCVAIPRLSLREAIDKAAAATSSSSPINAELSGGGEDGDINASPANGGFMFPRVSDRFKNRTQMEVCDKLMRHIIEDRVWNARVDRTAKPSANADPHAQSTALATSIYPTKRIDGYMGALGEMVKFNHDGMLWLEQYLNGSIPLAAPTEVGNYARREDETLLSVFRRRLLQFAGDHNLLVRLIVVSLMNKCAFPINYVRKDRFWDPSPISLQKPKPHKNSVDINEDVLSLMQANYRRVMEPSSVLLSRLFFVRQLSRKFLHTLLTPFALAAANLLKDPEATTATLPIIDALPNILSRYVTILATFSPSAFEDCGDGTVDTVEGLNDVVRQCLECEEEEVTAASSSAARALNNFLGTVALTPCVLGTLYAERGATSSSLEGVGALGILGDVEPIDTDEGNQWKITIDETISLLSTTTQLEKAAVRIGRPQRCLHPVMYPEDLALLSQKPLTFTVKPLLRGADDSAAQLRAILRTGGGNTNSADQRDPILASSYVAVTFDNSPSAPHSYFVGPSPALVDQYRHAINDANVHFTNHYMNLREKCPVINEKLLADPALCIYTLIQNTQSIHPDEMESTDRLCVITTSLSIIMKAHLDDPVSGIDTILSRLVEIEFAFSVKSELEDARKAREGGDDGFQPGTSSALAAAYSSICPHGTDDWAFSILAGTEPSWAEQKRLWLVQTIETETRKFYDVARAEDGTREVGVPPLAQTDFLVNQRAKSLIISDDVAEANPTDTYSSCQPHRIPPTYVVEGNVFDAREYGIRDAMSTTDAFNDLFQKYDFCVRLFRILSTWVAHYSSSQRYIETVYVCTQIPFAEWKCIALLVMGRLPFYFKRIQAVLLQRQILAQREGGSA